MFKKDVLLVSNMLSKALKTGLHFSVSLALSLTEDLISCSVSRSQVHNTYVTNIFLFGVFILKQGKFCVRTGKREVTFCL